MKLIIDILEDVDGVKGAIRNDNEPQEGEEV